MLILTVIFIFLLGMFVTDYATAQYEEVVATTISSSNVDPFNRRGGRYVFVELPGWGKRPVKHAEEVWLNVGEELTLGIQTGGLTGFIYHVYIV